MTFAAATAAARLSGNNALPSATPFNDRVKNLLKYAFTMNLAGPDVRTITAGGHAGLPASWIPLTDMPTTVPIDASWERVIYEEASDPAVLPSCFGRVEVSIP